MSKHNRPQYIWEGVYKTLEEAKAKGKGFASSRWKERINSQLLNYRDEIQDHSLVMPARMSDLPFLVTLTNARRIVDFGGSSGWVYDFLNQAMPNNNIEDYVIFELEEIVQYMQDAELHSAPVSYISDIGDFNCERGVDIFYTNSVLQYIYDDASIQEVINKSKPKWLLIDDFIGGDFENYFSLQNYYESHIPIIFRNRKDFIDSLKEYELMLSKPYRAEIFGAIQELPMNNFPIDKRVRFGETLLLRRKT